MKKLKIMKTELVVRYKKNRYTIRALIIILVLILILVPINIIVFTEIQDTILITIALNMSAIYYFVYTFIEGRIKDFDRELKSNDKKSILYNDPSTSKNRPE